MEPLAPDARLAYLRRLGPDAERVASSLVDGRRRPDEATVRQLQVAHLLAVPFENLDIHLGRPIALDPAAIHRKVVDERRGGYCYELNSQFARLLVTLGYRVDLLSARVATGSGRYGADFDHLALLVRGGAVAHPLLVDVGFGDAFTEPLPLIDGRERDDRRRRVRLRALDPGWVYEEDRGGGWRPQYRFTTTPHTLADFEPRNHWQQTSPDSHFTTGAVCTRLTPTGRITLSGRRLIVTDHTVVTGRTVDTDTDHTVVTDDGSVRHERQLEVDEIAPILAESFGVELPAPLPAPTLS